MQRALQLSLHDYNSRKARAGGHSGAQNGHASSSAAKERSLDKLDEEIEEVKQQISGLEALLQALCKERDEKVQQMRAPEEVRRRRKVLERVRRSHRSATEVQWVRRALTAGDWARLRPACSGQPTHRSARVPSKEQQRLEQAARTAVAKVHEASGHRNCASRLPLELAQA